MKKSDYILGLDLGTNSIGWSAVFLKGQTLDLGVRVFPAGLDRFNTPKEASLNEERRTKRAARRTHKRKAKRKAYLKSCLEELNWMPSDAAAIAAWNNLNVYALRSRAIRERVSLHELGRNHSLLHRFDSFPHSDSPQSWGEPSRPRWPVVRQSRFQSPRFVTTIVSTNSSESGCLENKVPSTRTVISDSVRTLSTTTVWLIR